MSFFFFSTVEFTPNNRDRIALKVRNAVRTVIPGSEWVVLSRRTLWFFYLTKSSFWTGDSGFRILCLVKGKLEAEVF